MLSKFILRAAITAAALTCTTGSVSAEQYRVIITDFAVFPEVSYVQPGDTIIFENNSGVTRYAGTINQEWETEDIVEGQELAVLIEEGTPNEFYLRHTDTRGGEGADAQEIEEGAILGKLNFSVVERNFD